MKEIVRRCHVVVYVVMGVVVVASGSSPSAYIRGLIRRIDRGDPNGDRPAEDGSVSNRMEKVTSSKSRRSAKVQIEGAI